MEGEKLHDSISDVIKDISQPTEIREQQAPTVHVEEKPATAATQPVEEKPELTKEMLESGADITLAFFDFSQTSIFRWLITRKKNSKVSKLFGEGGLDKLEKLIDERDNNSDKKTTTVIYREFSDEEKSMLRIARSADEAIEGLPLSTEEKDMLKVPLMEIMKKRGGTIPPEYMLMLGILQITGARVAQVYMV